MSDAAMFGWEGAPGAGHELGPGFLARSQLVERWIARVRPRLVLEVGCGRGHLTARLAQDCERIVGVDLSPGAARLARGACVDRPNAAIALAGIDSLPFRATFDAIVVAEVLEHLDGDLESLRLVTEGLSASGWLIVTVPANPRLWTEQDVMAGHKRRYTREQLVSLLAAGGFRPVELVSWGFPVTRLLVLRGGPAAARYRQQGRRALPPTMRLARAAYAPFARPVARLENLLSRFDKGIGYAVLARRSESVSL